MSIKTSKKRRTVGIAISAILLAAILLTGTFAFILPMQHRSDEFDGGGVRYDATLNENFIPVDDWSISDPMVTKQINVTNTGNNARDWGSVFVRINLREFMEIYDTQYYYWAADGTTMVAQDDMEGDAALFMTDSNNLAGNASRVFVVAPSTREADGTWTDMTEGEARHYIVSNYGLLFPGLDFDLGGRLIVLTTDYVSGVRGWFVISEAGDLHGQYGRYMVADVVADTTNPQIIGTPTISRAENVEYGVHEPNGECDYDIHQWLDVELTGNTTQTIGGDLPAPTSNYRDWVRWTAGANVILYSDWDGQPTANWIIDDRAGETDGWVYWGRELRVGDTTANFLEGVRLLEQPDGNFYYVIHTHMESVSIASIGNWPDDFQNIAPLTQITIMNPAGNTLPLNGPAHNFTVVYVDNTPQVDLGNGFVLRPGPSGQIGYRDSVVTFGSYRQTFIGSGTLGAGVRHPNSSFALEPLSWYVLDVTIENGIPTAAKLLSRDLIDNVAFGLSTAAGNSEWQNSNARAWLNSLPGGIDNGTQEQGNSNAAGFLNIAFNATERTRILPTTTTAADDGPAVRLLTAATGDRGPNNLFGLHTPPVPAIVNGDRVFILSIAEIWRYLGANDVDLANVGEAAYTVNMMTRTTDYAWSKGVARGLSVAQHEAGVWYTRTQSSTNTTQATAINAVRRIASQAVNTAAPTAARPAITVTLVNPS